ncbi:hypothetical protein, partial [Immundisolibacter sp.]|uniref:hypothetical protein n=1 Tax=Immundisolibacter sp. TaxID=1934948 RepID=UPI0025BDAD58
GVCGRGTASVRPEGAQNPKYPAETRTFTQSTSENGPFFPQLDHALAPSCPRRRFRWIDQRFPKQQRREPKKNIIYLWNDRQYREFARAAIDYYLTHHRNYDGWRVVNPMRLPRRR